MAAQRVLSFDHQSTPDWPMHTCYILMIILEVCIFDHQSTPDWPMHTCYIQVIILEVWIFDHQSTPDWPMHTCYIQVIILEVWIFDHQSTPDWPMHTCYIQVIILEVWIFDHQSTPDWPMHTCYIEAKVQNIQNSHLYMTGMRRPRVSISLNGCLYYLPLPYRLGTTLYYTIIILQFLIRFSPKSGYLYVIAFSVIRFTLVKISLHQLIQKSFSTPKYYASLDRSSINSLGEYVLKYIHLLKSNV